MRCLKKWRAKRKLEREREERQEKEDGGRDGKAGEKQCRHTDPHFSPSISRFLCPEFVRCLPFPFVLRSERCLSAFSLVRSLLLVAALPYFQSLLLAGREAVCYTVLLLLASSSRFLLLGQSEPKLAEFAPSPSLHLYVLLLC